MRRWNALFSLAALILLLLHGILGSFQLIGANSIPSKLLSWLALILLLLHAALGVKYTAASLRVWKMTGVGYFRENRLFWTRRISGFAVLVLLFFHVGAFGTGTDEIYRLRWFTQAKLVLHLLLAASLSVHILTNLRPLMLSLGLRGGRKWLGDILFVLALLLLFMAAAFAVYYLRWNIW